MSLQFIRIGIVVVRSRGSGPWAGESWQPIAALPDVPDLADWSALDSGAGDMRYAGAADLELNAGQTGHYRDNLQSGRPALWVALLADEGRYRVHSATADPYEGESMAEGVGELVEAVPMPPAIMSALEAFIARHHVERPFVKRQRDRFGRREQGRE